MKYRSMIVLALLTLTAGCQRPASVKQPQTPQQEKAALVALYSKAARSISTEEATKAGSIITNTSRSNPLNSEQIRFLLGIARKTEGKEDGPVYELSVPLALARTHSYPADVRNDVFEFTRRLLTKYPAGSEQANNVITISARIFTQLGDRRAIAVLRAYPRTNNRYYNYNIEKTIRALSSAPS